MSDSSKDPLTPSPENIHVQTMSLGPKPVAIPYGVKLNGVNYSLWSQVVETFVASRGKFGYSIGKTPNPSTDDASYDRWSMENDIVKGWLIGAMEPDLMNFRPVSIYYADLHAIWQELEYRKPITFSQPDVNQAQQKEIDEERVYIFLASLDDLYDRVRSDILHTEPFPNPDNAFVVVKSEEQRRNTMLHSQVTPSVTMEPKTTLTQNLL
ncbi:hypothetical protein D0Y65_000645 [Glycine soja]|uniref:Retrotransposon Copia-like N-terminal domain-containing protein n=1 Tax=Glycine soja TaxID=3848 RepID=A0A445LZP5_GLYSO|nr:hypothetical protein D0Y65_000645 [Glycine soja]